MVHVPDAHTDQPGQSDQTAKDVQAASRSTADFIQNVAPVQAQKRKSRNRRTMLIVLAVILCLGGSGYAVYSFLNRSSEKKATTSQSADSETAEDIGLEDGLKRFTSTDLNLSFKYPEDWQVNDQEQNKVVVESPVVKLPDAGGQEVDAKIVLTVESTGKDMSDFPEDKATGVRKSEKFSYDSPAEGQRQETFISFMNLSGASQGLNAVYITGDSSYTRGDPITKADFDKVQPIIGITFQACPDPSCSQGEAVIISADAWGSNSNLQTVFAILKSFSIK